VIDIDLTVADSADEPAWLPPLEEAGFELVVREPWWHEPRCLRHEQPRCNLHVFSPGCLESNAAGERVMEYNARKQPVIRAIYDRAFRAARRL